MIHSDVCGGEATPVFHFTHIDNLATLAAGGLQCDTRIQATRVLQQEVGNQDIKSMRRAREVPIPPGGVVADYVPFYFAPRSPMMYAIHMGNVPTYVDGCDEIVYLCSALGRLRDTGSTLVLTDRNAALAHASFASHAADLDIDWPLMGERYWNSTPEYPDRREKRMAECLAYEVVAPGAIEAVAVKSQAVANKVTRLVGTPWPVTVSPGWYF